MPTVSVTHAFGEAGATAAEGHVVVIDVLRAFTTAAYAFAAGANEVMIVSGIEEAFALRNEDSSRILVGENGGRPIDGFDFGNSPAALAREDLTGRNIILRSSNGTQGVVQASGAERILLGSLVVASASARFLQQASACQVTLVAMGGASSGRSDGVEDKACAEYIAGQLLGRPVDVDRVVQSVRNSRAGRFALDPDVDHISPEDLECAVAVDCFDFAMVVERRKDILVAQASVLYQ